MSNDELADRLRATFAQEIEEHVGALNDGLLTLEQEQGDEDLIRALFRSAHTIKGAARVTGITEIERVCHAMESVFAAVRDGRRDLTGSDFSLLFATCDALQDAATRVRAAQSLDGSAITALVPRLEAIAPDDDGAAPMLSTTATPRARQPAAEPPEAGRETADASRPAAAHESDAGHPGTTESSPAPRGATDDELVRVSAERLDTLLAAVGELIIASGRIVERSERDDEDARRLDAVTDSVAEVVHRLRLRPFGDACTGLPRAVRDVAAAEHKDVDLAIVGKEVEADRGVIDTLRDPLLHIVRNAVDHGIETPEVRRAAGKPARGSIRVAAELAAGRMIVTVSDDGAGLDEESVRRTLRERGQPEPSTSAELAEALLTGGFSTRQHTTAISGRGVGLDIVRAALERIGGSVDVEWEPGRGTTFILSCPPTPSTIRAVLMRVGPYVYAVPTIHVERLKRVRSSDLRSATGSTVLPTADGPIRVFSLARLLGPPLEARPLGDTSLVAIISTGARRAALLIDDVIDEEEIVMRPLVAKDGAVPHAAGAAILPSGTVALVLSATSLLAAGLRSGTAIAPAPSPERESRRQRVLVADDSITTRMLEQSVLESAGYEVAAAVNGEEAWRMLEELGADALVADVEMPRMDGFALCRRVRASERFRELPIVLVTGLDSPDDRARGLDAGADAYIVKSSFDQAALVDTLHQLIGQE